SVTFKRSKDPKKANAEAPTRAIKWATKSPVSPKKSPLVSTALLTLLCANTAVNNIPTIPPTPWQGKTSNVSSIPFFVLQITTKLLITAATIPITNECGIVTKPAAGVIATNPTTAPIQAPIAEGFFPRRMSKKIQAIAAAADAVVVVPNAEAASSLAPPAEPALNPNHPNHSKPVPKMT